MRQTKNRTNKKQNPYKRRKTMANKQTKTSSSKEGSGMANLFVSHPMRNFCLAFMFLVFFAHG